MKLKFYYLLHKESVIFYRKQLFENSKSLPNPDSTSIALQWFVSHFSERADGLGLNLKYFAKTVIRNTVNMLTADNPFRSD